MYRTHSWRGLLLPAQERKIDLHPSLPPYEFPLLGWVVSRSNTTNLIAVTAGCAPAPPPANGPGVGIRADATCPPATPYFSHARLLVARYFRHARPPCRRLSVVPCPRRPLVAPPPPPPPWLSRLPPPDVCSPSYYAPMTILYLGSSRFCTYICSPRYPCT